MKYELFKFQQDATFELQRRIMQMQEDYERYQSRSSVALVAPTGAGKTVISAAVIEGILYGDNGLDGMKNAIILWLSDSPDLNKQTRNRFEESSDLLTNLNMEIIGSDFTLDHDRLFPGHVYFLNRQLLGKGNTLESGLEGRSTFYDVLANTIIASSRAPLLTFIDEAHRGLGDSSSDERKRQTIYSKLINGQEGINPPLPIVVGISATPERFENTMSKDAERVKQPAVSVSVEEVRESGLIKDKVELWAPEHKTSSMKSVELEKACERLGEVSREWDLYCSENHLPSVNPLLIVQVEDKISEHALGELCETICASLPWLDRANCFANVFGDKKDLLTPFAKIPYCPHDRVADQTEIRVLFAKQAITTGWDCPRAEVLFSRRTAKDATYIAQLLGRMVRTPLGKRIDSSEILNTASCYLPDFDSKTLDLVIDQMRNENNPLAEEAIKHPTRVYWFGNVEAQLDSESFEDEEKGGVSEILARLPKSDKEEAIKKSFEGIVTRMVQIEKPSVFADLDSCISIIAADLVPNGNFKEEIGNEFCKRLSYEIENTPEFLNALNDVKSTQISVKTVDVLTGKEYGSKQERHENDERAIEKFYKEAIKQFGETLVGFYLDNNKSSADANAPQELLNISAAAQCFEITARMEKWAEEKLAHLIDEYSPEEGAMEPENKKEWEFICGNAKPYSDRVLSISNVLKTQSEDNTRFEKHIFCNEQGWAYVKLDSDWEKTVIERELARPSTVAWYRNTPRNLGGSLSIACEIDGVWKNIYPDFIFFGAKKNGDIYRKVIDPHGDWIGDSIPRLKGFVSYLKDYPKLFDSFLVMTTGKDGKLRYLDLLEHKTQDKINNFSGVSAAALFEDSDISREYIISHFS